MSQNCHIYLRLRVRILCTYIASPMVARSSRYYNLFNLLTYNLDDVTLPIGVRIESELQICQPVDLNVKSTALATNQPTNQPLTITYYAYGINQEALVHNYFSLSASQYKIQIRCCGCFYIFTIKPCI
jgi:hypothetical protein